MNPATMLGEARALHAAGDRLLVEESTGDDSFRVFPTHAMILSALAAEVALKAAICRERNIDNAQQLKAVVRSAEKRGSPHNLSILFSLLTTEEQAALKERVLDTIPQTQTIVGIFNQDKLTDIPAITVRMESTSFEQQLENVSLCFEEWRYSYELPLRLINKTFLRCLGEAAIHLFQRPSDWPESP